MLKKYILNTKEEWLNLRKNYIGGSDASCILGLNPYKSNVELWEEKVGLKEATDISDKQYVKYGTEAEKPLRELFQLDYPHLKVSYEENNIILNDKLPFAHASLDAELFDEEKNTKGILEIKTSTIHNSLGWLNWKDKIPDNYYIQCLHYLMVTEYDFLCLKAQLKSVFHNNITTKHYILKKNEVLDDIEYLKQKEEEFYKLIINKKSPNLILPEI